MRFRAMADHDLSRNPIRVETSPRRHHRRNFLTLGAAAAAVVIGITAPLSADAADPFGFARVASTDYGPDAAILDLFHQWRGALDAAVRFCPELAPLAAGALSSPRVLPVDEGDAA